MKKLLVVACLLAVGQVSFGEPRGCPAPRCCPAPVHYRPAPHCPAPHHPPCHRDYDFWGPGGRNFWPGFLGGVVGGTVATVVSKPAPPPPAVQPVVVQPVVVQTTPVVVNPPKRVWIGGHYEDVIQPNGVVAKTWIPGYWAEVR